jgi:hypothetical protein
VPTPVAGFPLPTDPRRDMIRELIAARLAAELGDAESKLKEIVQTGEARSQQRADQAGRRGGAAGTTTSERGTPTSEQVQRALQLLQREAGLPVTGRFDDATAALLVKLGLARAPDAPPKDNKVPEPKPEPKPTTTTEPKAERKPIDLAGQAQRRQAIAGQEQLLKARFAPPPSSSSSSASAAAGPKAEGFRAETRETPLDRALDPARLLASLVAAGFQGPSSSSSLGEALQAFQLAKGLPPSAQLDKATAAALGAAGVVSAEAASAMAAATEQAHAGEGAHSSTSAASSRDRVDVSSNTKGSGAATPAATTRAPAASPEEARERARLESLLALAEATERGAQAGDPSAVVGNARNAGQATGISGSGGAGGGADAGGDEAAHDLDGPAGDETSVGNSAAGDDDHDDEDRGEAVDAGTDDDADDDDGLIADGHYRVEKLSVQVHAALETIARLDDDGGPVHYSWDVTLYRPGVYADGQPAEAVWHLVVDRAHAFDPVWERATHAIAARLLYVEPEADAPSLDDVLGALRRARVR